MRKQLCDALIARAKQKHSMVFLTGDLGFMALEPLREAMGKRFINAGVAEQNMISVAAAMGREGMEAWAYSIAPFCYARPFEQIRNDIAFHGLSVKLIGNGGGYGYGVMGPTHHAIEDYGVLLTLPNMRVYVPAFDEDIEATVEKAGNTHGPAYLRLGRGELPAGVSAPAYAPWRQLTAGGGIVIVVAGPIAGSYIDQFMHMPESNRPNLWVVSELPIRLNQPPVQLIAQLNQSKKMLVIEEHVEQGGIASQLALFILTAGIALEKFEHRYALKHHYEGYGSQVFLRAQSSLDPQSIMSTISKIS